MLHQPIINPIFQSLFNHQPLLSFQITKTHACTLRTWLSNATHTDRVHLLVSGPVSCLSNIKCSFWYQLSTFNSYAEIITLIIRIADWHKHTHKKNYKAKYEHMGINNIINSLTHKGWIKRESLVVMHYLLTFALFIYLYSLYYDDYYCNVFVEWWLLLL